MLFRCVVNVHENETREKGYFEGKKEIGSSDRRQNREEEGEENINVIPFDSLRPPYPSFSSLSLGSSHAEKQGGIRG